MYHDRPMVYLAASYRRKEDIKSARTRLEKGGQICVVSQWLDEPHEEMDETVLHPVRVRLAQKNLQDLQMANVLAIWSEPGRGGHHVEFGFFLSKPFLPVFEINERLTLFHHLPRVQIVRDLEHLKSKILSWWDENGHTLRR